LPSRRPESAMLPLLSSICIVGGRTRANQEIGKSQISELQSDCPAVWQFSVVGDTGRSRRRDTFLNTSV
jgi:hypothetical protein